MTDESDKLNRIADANRIAALEATPYDFGACVRQVLEIDRLRAKLAEVERQRDLALAGEQEKARALTHAVDSEVRALNERRVVEAEVARLHAALASPPDEGGAPDGFAALDWPRRPFSFYDDPGEHDPCYVVTPSGEMLPLNQHATPGVDVARARWIIDACNEALRRALAEPAEEPGVPTVDECERIAYKAGWRAGVEAAARVVESTADTYTMLSLERYALLAALRHIRALSPAATGHTCVHPPGKVGGCPPTQGESCEGCESAQPAEPPRKPEEEL